MENVTQRPQVAHEQALFPHDVLLMPADQLACMPPRKLYTGALTLYRYTLHHDS